MKIYFVSMRDGTESADWRGLAAHARALGFTTLAANIVPETQAQASENDEAIRAFARAASEQGLAAMMDISLDQPAAFGLGPVTGHVPSDEQAFPPDPRYLAQGAAPADWLAGELGEGWRRRLPSFARCGVTRFRCLRPRAATPSAWANLIAATRREFPGCAFHVWTPGLSWGDVARLAGAGFAGGFTSGAWWDFRARWFAGEAELLDRLGPAIAFPRPPACDSAPPPPPAPADGSVGRIVAGRALRLAATTAHGLLMPMGFEFGLEASIEPDIAAPIESLRGAARYDLTAEASEANALVDRLAEKYGPPAFAGGGGERVAALLRAWPPADHAPAEGVAILINRDARAAAPAPATVAMRGGGAALIAEETQPGPPLSPGEVRLITLHSAPMIRNRLSPTALRQATEASRIVIDKPAPAVDGGRFPSKHTLGDAIDVEADIFIDGHDVIAADLLWRPVDETEWRREPMAPLGNDRWRARIIPRRIGRHVATIEAWQDLFGGLRRDAGKKLAAGMDATLEIQEARELVAAAMMRADISGQTEFRRALEAFDAGEAQRAVVALLADSLRDAMAATPDKQFRTRLDTPLQLDIESPQASFASWYEMFPRSATDDPARHGTFADVIERLPAIRAMGFDVLYFPPIHPIGVTNRKGRNNSLIARPDDPGSPYAIGGAEGGHDAIHPELGTFDDFRRLVAAARKQGLEIALDFAIQCSPDHPWLNQHPGWFKRRPDGSIRYAENPPKKYEDIVNVDFFAAEAIPELWIALRDVVAFWLKEGVRMFRVDNPHTKPLSFWRWMIADIRARRPDAIFLSEAFTRPKMMYRLAKVGFSQSYTYFTWRNEKREIIEYLQELTTAPVKDFFRPHFFVNTPDINPYFLQTSGRAGFLIRAALAATLSGLWGVYSGFELCEAAPLPGREEYLDSEKYEIRTRDDAAPGNIIAEITALNRLRREFPVLQTHLGVRFYNAVNDSILFYGKGDAASGEIILVFVSLDPHHAQEAMVEIPLWEFGLHDDAALAMEDLMRGDRYIWSGKWRHVRFDPADAPYLILRAARPDRSAP